MYFFHVCHFFLNFPELFSTEGFFDPSKKHRFFPRRGFCSSETNRFFPRKCFLSWKYHNFFHGITKTNFYYTFVIFKKSEKVPRRCFFIQIIRFAIQHKFISAQILFLPFQVHKLTCHFKNCTVCFYLEFDFPIIVIFM